MIHDDALDLEEAFHQTGKRESRKERKMAANKDRSKYKKTDRKDYPPPPKGNFERGRVLTISSEGVLVQLPDRAVTCSLRGSLKKEKSLHKNLVTTGDFVLVDGISIVYIEERQSTLSRAENLHHRKQQLIAANIDQVLIVSSIIDPILKPSLIDRYIITALKGNMQPVIIINKIDLLEPCSSYEAFREAYSNLGYPYIEVSATCHTHLAQIQTILKDKASCLSGQSGVGKTSLINALLNLNLPTAEVAHRTRKGAHTTTQSSLIPLTCGGFLIDTPGIKSFGLWNLDKNTLASYYPEFTPFASNCQFKGCTHTHEPSCAVKAAVEEELISILRYNSYIDLLHNID